MGNGLLSPIQTIETREVSYYSVKVNQVNLTVANTMAFMIDIPHLIISARFITILEVHFAVSSPKL